MKMRVLIAGCGDLGLHLAQLLLNHSNHSVLGIRRTPPVAQDESGIEWIRADLTDPDTLIGLPKDITHIVYAAAPNIRSEQAYRETYVLGLQNVLQAIDSPSLKRVIFISSTAVYGDHGQDWVDENTPTQPVSFNGHILCEAERWLTEYAVQNKVSAICLRLSGIYGPGRNQLLEKLRLGLAAAPKTEEHWVNRIHIDDAAAAIVHLLSLKNSEPVYLVTDSTPLPMRTLYEYLAIIAGGPVPPVGQPTRTVGSKKLSNARLIASGYTFKWPDSRDAYSAG